jgi:dethiobiotin synthetase
LLHYISRCDYLSKGFFITGTDTGVGKTIITAALILQMKKMGLKVCGMKPVETGCLQKKDVSTADGSDLIPLDGTFLTEVAACDEPSYLISPQRYSHPLAPLAAGRIEGREVNFEKIRNSVRVLFSKYEFLVMEGIGGLLVPVSSGFFALDFAREFNLPLIIVARAGLGTINHTLLTVSHARKEGLGVAGIAINYTSPAEGTLAEKTNPGILGELAGVPIIGTFPYLGNVTREAIEEAAGNLDMEALVNYM